MWATRAMQKRLSHFNPMPRFNSYRYEFTAQPAGTHWYHSHTGFQREEGLYGPVIIRLPSELDIHSQLYDHDLSAHTFVLSDWYPEQAANRFQEMNHRRNPTMQPLQPLSGLINGKTKRYEVTNVDIRYSNALQNLPRLTWTYFSLYSGTERTV